MKHTCVSIGRGHILQEDNLASAETRIFKKSFQRLCQSPEPRDASVPRSCHSSQCPSSPAKRNREPSIFRRGPLPDSALEMCSRASSRLPGPRARLENAGVSRRLRFGLLGETAVCEPPGCDQESCCQRFCKKTKPTSFCWGQVPPCPRSPHDNNNKSKDYCQRNSSPPKSVAGGKMLGH